MSTAALIAHSVIVYFMIPFESPDWVPRERKIKGTCEFRTDNLAGHKVSVTLKDCIKLVYENEKVC